MSRAAYEAIPGLVARLYEIVDELEEQFPGRKFTVDGHMAGSIGEVLAAYAFALELLPNSTPGLDATYKRKAVQIKFTQRRSVGLREPKDAARPDLLLVLAVERGHQVQVVYNGPSGPAFDQAGTLQSNGQRSIALSKLAKIDDGFRPSQRIPQQHELPVLE